MSTGATTTRRIVCTPVIPIDGSPCYELRVSHVVHHPLLPESTLVTRLFTGGVQIEVHSRKGTLTIPSGFTWAASIPRIAWTALGLTPWHPLVMRAALVHDFLYEHEGPTTRAQADLIFRDLLIEDGLDRVRADTVYAAVRQFGRQYWLDAEDVEAVAPPVSTDEDFSA